MKSLLKSIKAQSHIEMILSFVIFIGFVVAMLIFLNPVKEQKISYASVDIAENKILENVSFTYSYVGLILATPASGSCFYVENIPNQAGKFIVRDGNEALKKSFNDESAKKLYIESTPGARFYKLYFSNKFSNYSISNPSSCQALARANYTFGPLYLDKAIFYNSLKPLQDAYMADYSGLRSSMNLAEDFEFVIYNLNKTQILFDTTSKHKVKTSMVLSRDLPLRILNNNATPTDIIFNIRVW